MTICSWGPSSVKSTNEFGFGNGACLFTESGSNVRYFRENIEVSMLSVNIVLPDPMAFFPFSGWKNSFYGDLHANGSEGWGFLYEKEDV